MERSIKQILIQDAGLTEQEADERIEAAQKRIYEEEDDLKIVLREEFGLGIEHALDLLRE